MEPYLKASSMESLASFCGSSRNSEYHTSQPKKARMTTTIRIQTRRVFRWVAIPCSSCPRTRNNNKDYVAQPLEKDTGLGTSAGLRRARLTSYAGTLQGLRIRVNTRDCTAAS